MGFEPHDQKDERRGCPEGAGDVPAPIQGASERGNSCSWGWKPHALVRCPFRATRRGIKSNKVVLTIANGEW